MSSVRPLVTITVLAVVGAYLYVKINEGAVQPASSAPEGWAQPADDVPPLAATPPAAGAATPWPATAVEPAPLATPTESPAAANEAAPATPTAAAPAVPAIPEMPEIAATTQSDPPAPAAAATTEPAAPAAAAAAAPAALPGDRYSVQPPVTPVAPAETAPPAANSTTDSGASAAAAAAAPVAAAAALAATTPEEMNAAATAPGGLQSAPLASQPNPLRQSAPPTAADRYATDAAAPVAQATAPPAEAGLPPVAALAPAAPITPATTTPEAAAGQSFGQSWPAIQAALDRGELAEAHQQLTRWYADPSLTPTDAERVDTLLSQLAGTVVYSTEHRLAPAHVVKEGETLETIAQQYNVPAPLLAKINGVAADQVRAGQELKVVRGPFEAVVDVGRGQITLMVDGRYAGKFPVTIAPGQAVADGEWVVGQKSNPQAPGRALLLQGKPAAAGTAAPSLVIASDTLPLDGANATVIKVAATDAEELSDILSVGSRVVTRR